jgi:tRNA(Arg) A34 adenosine deaminase TadA
MTTTVIYSDFDKAAMQLAIDAAERAITAGDMPFGASLVALRGSTV